MNRLENADPRDHGVVFLEDANTEAADEAELHCWFHIGCQLVGDKCIERIEGSLNVHSLGS